MKVVERAACRVDFSGGTLDLWPLYLYQYPHQVVHMAVNIFATAEVEFKRTNSGTSITVQSDDLSCQKKYSSLTELKNSLNKNTKENPLRWLNRIVQYYLEEAGMTKGFTLKIKTQSEALPGSGLGGSSVLGIALSKAILKAFHPKKKIDLWKLQTVTRDLEAIEIEHPAGDQDYVPALFRGLLIFEQGPGYKSIKKIDKKIARNIASKSALIYTGKPHHSGINNWQIFKKFHDKDKLIHKNLEKIGKLSKELASLLLKGDERRFFQLVNEEWKTRQKLGKMVNAPELEKAWKLAQKNGAISRKGCGAGGGGCLWVGFPDQKTRDQFVKTAKFPGGKIYKISVV